MDIQTPPDYLYHYTNVDSLALILKNRTIRLNALDKMDDKQEQLSTDKQNFGKFVFVSSWTDSKDEDIPMWRMYTPKTKGVRLKLHSNPFEKYAINPEELSRVFGEYYPSFSVSRYVAVEDVSKIVVPIEDCFNSTYYVANHFPNKQLIKIEYTDDFSSLNPTLLTIVGDKFLVDHSRLGNQKNTYWKFQNEWRYKLVIVPLSMVKTIVETSVGDNSQEMYSYQQRIENGTAALPFSHFDLRIEEEFFKDMEITLAPDISESAKLFVELLVKEFNPTCKVQNSVLTDLIQ